MADNIAVLLVCGAGYCASAVLIQRRCGSRWLWRYWIGVVGGGGTLFLLLANASRPGFTPPMAWVYYLLVMIGIPTVLPTITLWALTRTSPETASLRQGALALGAYILAVPLALLLVAAPALLSSLQR